MIYIHGHVSYYAMHAHISLLLMGLTLAMELAASQFHIKFTHSRLWWGYKVLPGIGAGRRREGLEHAVLIVSATLPGGLASTSP